MKLRNLTMAICLLFVCCGCSTPVGPFSYFAARSVEASRVTRSVYSQGDIPQKYRDTIMRAVALGARPEEIAAGVEIDVYRLFSSPRTWDETAHLLLSDLADLSLYTYLTIVALEKYNDD